MWEKTSPSDRRILCERECDDFRWRCGLRHRHGLPPQQLKLDHCNGAMCPESSLTRAEKSAWSIPPVWHRRVAFIFTDPFRPSLLERIQISDVISSYRVYASCFPAMTWGKLWDMFVIVTSLSYCHSDSMVIFLNQLIQFYSNNATNFHHLTLQSTTCWPTTWR